MRIAILCSRFPYPLEQGDKLRVFQQIRHLAERGHEIGLFCLSEQAVSPPARRQVEAYCHQVSAFHVPKRRRLLRAGLSPLHALPLQVGYFFHPGLVEDFRSRILEFKPDHLFCQLIRMAEYAKAVRGISRTLDYMDAFSFILKSRSAQSPLPLRLPLALESRRIAGYEANVFSHFDHHTIISERDRDAMPFAARDRISVVPNGVDTEYFHPFPHHKPPFDLVFIGNLGYYPNVAAVQWFCQKVLPRLRRKKPDLRVFIGGARPVRAVRRLNGPNVTIEGWISDIRQGYKQGRVFVAPIFQGGGLQNKLLEAMAMGIPAVTTSRVNASLKAIPGETVLVADDPERFAQAILTLLADEAKARRLGEAAREFVVRHHRWMDSAKALERIFLGEKGDP